MKLNGLKEEHYFDKSAYQKVYWSLRREATKTKTKKTRLFLDITTY